MRETKAGVATMFAHRWGVMNASVCRTDAHPQAKDDCVKALATRHQNDGSTGRILHTECAQVDVT